MLFYLKKVLEIFLVLNNIIYQVVSIRVYIFYNCANLKRVATTEICIPLTRLYNNRGNIVMLVY